MEVDFESATISKPQGKRSPAGTIGFGDLLRYITVFKEVVDVESPTVAMDQWVGDDYAEGKVLAVLYSVIVLFGGGYRIWGRFEKTYDETLCEVNRILSLAHKMRADDIADVRAILKHIPGLGGLSYSTKMLRFLNPRHVVLDSILCEELGLKEADYRSFAHACGDIAEALKVSPADVESGLFAYVQVSNPGQRSKAWKRYQAEFRADS